MSAFTERKHDVFKIRSSTFVETMKCKLLAALFMMTLLPTILYSTNAFADPNTLLGNAIKESLRLNDESFPTKERLKVYEKVFGLLDQITTGYPSSEQAIKIVSQQTIGKFDPSLLKDGYVKELSKYYEIVCKTSPSPSCFGFVSLKTGRDMCEGAGNLQEVYDAHKNLKNAARIFIGQKQKDAYITLALNEYRDCLSRSNFENTEYAVDFFSSEILDLFLQSGNKHRAKATIENMTTPAFKFAGVLKLYESDGKEFSKSFFDRMDAYITKTISKNENPAAPLSAIRLADAATRLATFKVGYDITYDAVQRWRGWGTYASNCDPFFSKYLADIITDYQKNIVNMPEERNDIGDANLAPLMAYIAERPSEALGACKQNPDVSIRKKDDGGEEYSADVSPSAQNAAYYDYFLMALIHGQLLVFKPEKAEEFYEKAINEYWSQKQQIRYAANVLLVDRYKLKFFTEFQDIFEMEPGTLQNAHIREVFLIPLARPIVYEKMVDFEMVCEASELLFQELKGTDYDEAIEYMITSRRLNPDKQYECGDEDLELLLN